MGSVALLVAFIGFTGGDTFYNALLVNIASRKQTDFVSSLGYSLGYIGGGLLFTFCILLYLQPAWFGLSSATTGIQFSFISVLSGGLFLLFLLFISFSVCAE